MIRKMSEVIQKQRNKSLNMQTEAVLQRCSYKKMLWNMQQIYWRTPMPKFDFHVDTKQFYWNILLLLGCSFVNLLNIFRTVSHKNALRRRLLNIVTNKRQKGDIKIQRNRNYVYYSLFDVFISFPYRSYWKIQKYNGYRGWFLSQSNWSKMYRSTRPEVFY